jgi:hypothetical protein
MATATLVHLKVSQDGTKASMMTKYTATKFVDAATTVSFTAGTDEHTIADSAAGFGSVAVGDQIEVSGSANDDNNGFFRVNAKASSSSITVERRGDGAETNGVTESAGPAITISLVPKDTNCTNGTVALSNGSTLTVVNTSPQSENHEVYMFSGCTIFPAVLHPTVDGDVTMTASAGAAWTDGGGNLSPAFSSTAITNSTKRLDATKRFDYDNHYQCVYGIGDAPYGVGTAVDPSTNGNLTEWWAPDLETGYTDGDDIATLVGQTATKNLTPRSGGSYPWTYETDSIRGVTAVKMKDRGGGEFGEAWTGLTAFGGGVAKTIIMCIHLDDPEASFSVYRPMDSGGSGPAITANRFDGLTGVAVVAVRDDGSGSGDAWYNYAREAWAVPAGQVRLMTVNSVAGLPTLPRVGRIYEIGEYVSDANMETYVRWLLNFYDDADWAPQIHVSSTGSDSNPGTQASPLLTVAGAAKYEFVHAATSGSNPTFPTFSPHFIVPEGETVDIRLSGDNLQSRRHNGYGDADWGCIRVRRTSSSPYPTFRTLGDGSGTQGLVGTSTAGAGRVSRKFSFIGACPREPRKIPTDSPLREVGDTAFSGAYVTQEKMIEITGSATDTDPTMCEVQLFNCHSVGGGLIGAQGGRFLEQADCLFDFERVSYAHAHGSGHTNPYFVSGPYTVFASGEVAPSPGYEPINSVEAADIFSHNHYDQFSGVGVKMFSDGLTVQASSHYFQARSGGVSLDGTMIVDAPVSIFGASTTTSVQNVLIEGGDDIAGSARGWLPQVSSGNMEMGNVLMIQSTYGSGQGITVTNTDDYYSTDGTTGPADGSAFVDMNGSYRYINIDGCTFHDRLGTAVSFTDVENSSITNNVIVAAGLPINIANTDAEVTAGTHTLTGNQFDITDNTLAATTDGARTLAQYEALMDTASSNTEAAQTFVDDTRSVRAYAKTYLDDVSATPLDLALEMVRQREAGTFDATLEVDYIRDWVYDGFEATSAKGIQSVPAVSTTTPSASATGVSTSLTTVIINMDKAVSNANFTLRLTDGTTTLTYDADDISIALPDRTEITVTVDVSTLNAGAITATLAEGSVQDTTTAYRNIETSWAFTIGSAGGNRSRIRDGQRLR